MFEHQDSIPFEVRLKRRRGVVTNASYQPGRHLNSEGRGPARTAPVERRPPPPAPWGRSAREKHACLGRQTHDRGETQCPIGI